MTFVDNVTDPESSDYIHPQDRIATFDFDGTIYCEKPIYANFEVCILHYREAVELIEYLLKEDFQVFICSGSMTGFLRGACEGHLPLDSSHIIGSRVELEYSFEDSAITFLRKENIIHNNDADGKALGIYNHIGKPPVIAVGNTCGDVEMLQYAQSNSQPNLMLVINHDDSTREYEYYDNKLLEICKQNGWIIVSMKEDFKNIFIK